MQVGELSVLFELVADALEAAGGELGPDIVVELSRLDLSPAVADGMIDLIQQFEARESEAKALASPHTSRARAAALAAEELKHYLEGRMEAAGVEQLRGARHSCRLQDNPAPIIRWPGKPETIPLPFQRVKIDLDPNAAKLAHRRGDLPPEFEVTTGRHLRIVG